MRYSIAAVVIATVLTTSTDTTPGPQTQLATVKPVARVSEEIGPTEPILDPLEAPV
jgi:hypothetical protein